MNEDFQRMIREEVIAPLVEDLPADFPSDLLGRLTDVIVTSADFILLNQQWRAGEMTDDAALIEAFAARIYAIRDAYELAEKHGVSIRDLPPLADDFDPRDN